jgi:GNAT superfamily N-acetyltransferase
MHAAIATAESQRELEKIADLVMAYIATEKATEITKAWSKDGIEMLYVDLRRIAYSGPLEDFTKEHRVEVTFPQDSGGDLGEYSKLGHDIRVYVDYKWFESKWDERRGYKDVTTDDILEFLGQYSETLMHELTHAYDDFLSKGKALRSTRELYKRGGREAYLNDAAEVNARYQAAVRELRKQKISTFKQLGEKFKEVFEGWDILPEDSRERLLKRLYVDFQHKATASSDDIECYKVTVTDRSDWDARDISSWFEEKKDLMPFDLEIKGDVATFYLFKDPKDERNQSKHDPIDAGAQFEQKSGAKVTVTKTEYPTKPVTLKNAAVDKVRDAASDHGLRNCIMTAGSAIIAYSPDDAVGAIAYAGGKPVGYALLSEYIFEDSKGKEDIAFFQRFVHPAYRRKRLSEQMFAMIVPKFKAKYPQYKTLHGSDINSSLQNIWDQALTKVTAGTLPGPLNDLIESKHGDVLDGFYTSENVDTIILSQVAIKKEFRDSGHGTKIMEDICKYADEHRKTVYLSPSKDFGASSVDRLKRFYKRFGFVENKGRNKDWTSRETMFRRPSSKATAATKEVVLYHGTNTRRLKEIEKRGLDPKAPKASSGDNFVYLTDSPEVAAEFSGYGKDSQGFMREGYMAPHDGKKQNGVILKVKVEKKLLEPDQIWADKLKELAGDEQSFESLKQEILEDIDGNQVLEFHVEEAAWRMAKEAVDEGEFDEGEEPDLEDLAREYWEHASHEVAEKEARKIFDGQKAEMERFTKGKLYQYPKLIPPEDIVDVIPAKKHLSKNKTRNFGNQLVSESSARKLGFFADCVGWPSKYADALRYIRDKGMGIERDEFLAAVSFDGDPNEAIPADDWHINYCEVGGVYFYVHSGIEYVYADESQIESIQKKLDTEETTSEASAQGSELYPKVTGTKWKGLTLRPIGRSKDSLPASLDDWEELGVRELPYADFSSPDKHFYDPKDFKRAEQLAAEIKENGEIEPLLVVVDEEGPYILEGQHRFVALHKLGYTTFPALVVLDLTEKPAEATSSASGLKIWFDYHSYHSGEHFFDAIAEIDGKGVGLLKGGYYKPDEVVSVKWVEVAPEARGKGVGKALYLALLTEFPTGKIDPGGQTPDGVKLWESVRKQIPDDRVYREEAAT